MVAAHARLAYDAATKQGQIEVMTTPFDHPILPLITDTDLAKIALPSVQLPSHRFQQPEDARQHVLRAQVLYQRLFGRAVTGMWPAEGSVSEAVVPLFSSLGVRWIASDRRVLERSTPADQPIYTPYRVDPDTTAGGGSGALAIVFRDTELSDKLGFYYQGGTPVENVADLRKSLLRHAPRYGSDRLLTVILDGENAWEHYRLDHDAKGFLRGMYTALVEEQQLGRLETVTVSEYLDGNPARGVTAHPIATLPELEPLFSGSWIGASYATWIGEEEENTAWDYLAQVREDLASFEQMGLSRPDPSAAEPAQGTNAWHAARAWTSMYAAEGSDWFWWYGSDQTADGGDDPFDRIFLALLRNVYVEAAATGLPVVVPDFPPILRLCRPPAGPMTAQPTIDGAFTPDGGDPEQPNEWTQAGAGVCLDVDSGARPNPDDDLAVYHHGLRPDAVLLALRFREDLGPKSDYQVRLYFSQKHLASTDPLMIEQDPKLDHTRLGTPLAFGAGGAAREVTIDLSGAATASVAEVDRTVWGPPGAAPMIEARAGERVVEVRIPNPAIHFQADDPLEMVITVVEGGREIDRAPASGTVVLASDRSQLVEVTLVVDVTGARLAIDAVKAIDDPPPPRGTGEVFIVGNQAEIGNWTPNSVAMSDDGETLGDKTAHDNLWTFRLLVPPGTDLQYKYTIGHAGQGWGPTEEYPLTNRGLVVKDLDGNRKLELHDVFADRPDPSGSIPEMTEIADP